MIRICLEEKVYSVIIHINEDGERENLSLRIYYNTNHKLNRVISNLHVNRGKGNSLDNFSVVF